MKRILVGLIALLALGAGGWFGFNLYVQHRATAEVEAAFARMRSGGGKASHGKVDFELASRTLIIEDIASNQPSRSWPTLRSQRSRPSVYVRPTRPGFRLTVSRWQGSRPPSPTMGGQG